MSVSAIGITDIGLVVGSLVHGPGQAFINKPGEHYATACFQRVPFSDVH